MLSVRVGRTKMPKRLNCRWILQCLFALMSVAILIALILQKWSQTVDDHWFLQNSSMFSLPKTPPKRTNKPCRIIECPKDHISFYMLSGAANVVAPKICLNNKLVLGGTLQNAGSGINIVVTNGKTEVVTKTDYFDMYSGEADPLIKFLNSIESGSVVLMASFDEPSTKLTDEAKKLISELGSKNVHSLAFRDNWLFVGGKDVTVKGDFEKLQKNDHKTNKYKDWPELIDLSGCIPKIQG